MHYNKDLVTTKENTRNTFAYNLIFLNKNKIYINTCSKVGSNSLFVINQDHYKFVQFKTQILSLFNFF